jgi:PTS system cellobiose-specific IIC component
MPIILNGIMEGGWKIAALQVVLVGVQMLVWYPFFRRADRESYALEQQNKLQE